MALPIHLTMTSIWTHRLQPDLTLITSYTILYHFTFGGLKSLFSFERISWQNWMNSPQKHNCSVAPWNFHITKHFKHWFLCIYNSKILLKIEPLPLPSQIWSLSVIWESLYKQTNKISSYIHLKPVAMHINLQIFLATMSGWFKVLSTVTLLNQIQK